MKRLPSRFLPPIAIALALLIDAIVPSVGRWLLIFSVLFGLYPLVDKVVTELFKKKRVDLGLPVFFTMLALLFLGETRTAAVFVLLIIFGQLFNEYVLALVKKSVESISEELPKTALVKIGAEIVETKISDIAKGQTIALKAGSRVPVDGVLLGDRASFDESTVTGESRPIMKKRGHRLIAGAVNLDAYAEMEATETSGNSTIAQVKRLVSQAQSRSAPLSKFTDIYATVTVAAAIIFCAVFYYLSRDVIRVMALWVALVPVVFAIIVPVSMTLGISLLARRGILVKTAEGVENLNKIDTVAFDKTGTLTKGRPEVADIVAMPGHDWEELLSIAAGAERYSEHHLGVAITRLAEAEELDLPVVERPQIIKGKGISSNYGGKNLLIGSQAFLAESGVGVADETINLVHENEEVGASAIFMALGGQLAGVFFIVDAVRDNAWAVLQRLRDLGLDIIMLTGDSEKVARKIAGDLGIDDFRAGCLPQDKAAHIIDLKKSGRKVAMVGDGINDAPALAEANVGIAMGLRGVDLALDSAHAVLYYDDLAVLPEAIESSREIFRTIRNDLFIATFIHVLDAILVVSGVIGILGSAVLHQVSSSLVLMNTLQLFRLGWEEEDA